MRSYLFLIFSCCVLLGACRDGRALTGAGSDPQASVSPIPTLNPDVISLGRQVYAVHCAECHGVELEGEREWQGQNEDGSFRAPPHDAHGHTWHHGDDVLIEAIQLGGARLPANIGVSNMPAYAGVLSNDEIMAVLAYIKSSWPEEIQAIQWEQTRGSQP